MHLAGLVGQSFSAPGPHNGKRDFYPTEGRFRTSAMAEGAIEGSAEMYRLPSGDTVEFDFSRFYTAALASRPGGLLLAAGEASAVDEGGDGGGPGAVAASGRPSRRLSEQDCDSDGIPDAEEGTGDADMPPPLPPVQPPPLVVTDADSNGIPDAWEAEDDGIVLATSHGLFMSLDKTSYTETERGCHCGPDTVDNYGSCEDQTNGPLTVPSGWKLAPYDSAIVDEVVATHSWGTDCMIFANGESYYTMKFPGKEGDNCTTPGITALGAIPEGYYAKDCRRRVLLMKST